MSLPCLYSTWHGNDCTRDAQEAEAGQARLSTSCTGALGTAAHTGHSCGHSLGPAFSLQQGLALHSAECWHTTALLPLQGQLQPGLPSVSSSSHRQDPSKAAATPHPCFVESLQGATGIAKPVTKCKNLVTLILTGFLGPIGSKARKHSAPVWSCSTTVF